MISVTPVAASDTCKTALADLAKKFADSDQGTTEFWGKNRAALKGIAQELDAEFLSKCGYCEAYPGGVSYLHIDHFLPKESHADLMYSWENFINACQICNNKKHKKEDPRLLCPLTDSPDASIEFRGPVILHKDDRGEYTILELGLDRAELEVMRREHLLTVVAVANLVADTTLDTTDLDLFAEFVSASTQADAPFAAVCRHALGHLPAPAHTYRELVKAVLERLLDLAT